MCSCSVTAVEPTTTDTYHAVTIRTPLQMRWDKANLAAYNEQTGEYLRTVYNQLDKMSFKLNENIDVERENINYIYEQVVHILRYCSKIHVPSIKKYYFKFWWDTELTELKQQLLQQQSCGNRAADQTLVLFITLIEKVKPIINVSFTNASVMRNSNIRTSYTKR